MIKIFSNNSFISTIAIAIDPTSRVVTNYVQINPGANLVSDENYELIKKNKFFHKMLKKNAYTVDESITKKEESGDNEIERIVNGVKSMTVAEVRKLIFGVDGIADKKVLDAIALEDSRKGVQDIISEQFQFLKIEN
jgi:hypothetical protein